MFIRHPQADICINPAIELINIFKKDSDSSLFTRCAVERSSLSGACKQEANYFSRASWKKKLLNHLRGRFSTKTPALAFAFLMLQFFMVVVHNILGLLGVDLKLITAMLGVILGLTSVITMGRAR